MDLISCSFCERRFNPEALLRHEPICRKTQQKKRKVFDSSKQRVEGTEITIKKRGPVKTADPPVKKNNWRQKHEDFVRTIRAARGVQAAMDRGEPLPPPPPPTINPDYVQCDYCNRRFNETAAARHIPFCKEQHERIPKRKPDQSSISQKTATRTQYQPPKTQRPVGGLSAVGQNTSYSDVQSKSVKSGYGINHQRGGYGTSSRSAENRSNLSSTDAPASGQALRTGRTVETYSEARKLSAKQRAAVPSKKYPSNDNVNTYRSQYTGTGYIGTPSSVDGRASGSKPDNIYPTNSEEMWNGYGSTYGYSSPGNVPRGRGKSTGPISVSRFCYDCGAKFPVPSAKFCCECGVPRKS